MLKVALIIVLVIALLMAVLYYSGIIKPKTWQMPFKKYMEKESQPTTEPLQEDLMRYKPGEGYKRREVAELIADTSAEIWNKMTDDMRKRTAEVEGLKEELLREKDRLQLAKNDLQEQRKELVQLQGRVEERIILLEKLRFELEALREEETTKLITQRVKIVERMEAPQAAEMLLGLEIAEAVQVLAGMKERTAGEIMTQMATEKPSEAGDILREFSGIATLPEPLKVSAE